MINTAPQGSNRVNRRKRYFNTINFQYISTQRLHSPVGKDRTFVAGGNWDAVSYPGVATSGFFFFFYRFSYPLAFHCLVSLLALLLASRDFAKTYF